MLGLFEQDFSAVLQLVWVESGTVVAIESGAEAEVAVAVGTVVAVVAERC